MKAFMVAMALAMLAALTVPAFAAEAVPVPGNPGWYTNPETPDEAAERIWEMEKDAGGGN
jgi:hypothetical protein